MVNFAMKSYNDLFGEATADDEIIEIALTEIDDFPDHPFKVLDDEDMTQLVESIKTNGIITPATVTLKDDGRYELVSGHRRKRACELAGLSTLKCVVVELSREEATILMVESNYQRTKILPSEKGFAYRMRLEAMNRQGKRYDLTSTPVVSKLRSNETLGNEIGESREQIRRYIRLTYLISELLDLVDKSKIKLRPAVEISYISEEYQHCILNCCESIKKYPSQKQATLLRQAFKDDELTESKISEILENKKEKNEIESSDDSEYSINSNSEKKSSSKNETAIPYSTVARYFPSSYSYDEVVAEVLKILEDYNSRI